MKHHLALGGRWLAGTGGVTALGYLIATEAAGGRHPMWPYWIFGSMLVVGLAMYFMCQDRGEQDGVAAVETPSPHHARTAVSHDGTVHNEIRGGTFSQPVVQARDITGLTLDAPTSDRADPDSTH